jgi:hypothetical protein
MTTWWFVILTNNTPARIDRNELYVDIAIEPVKAVEFIYIPVRIKNTGDCCMQSNRKQSGVRIWRPKATINNSI